MRLIVKKGTAFEQTLRQLREQYVRNAKEATAVLTEYYGVKPKKFKAYWGLGYTCIISPLDIIPEYIPETLKKGVKETDDGILTVDRRTKVGWEFLKEWETHDCAKGLSGQVLEQFGIYTLDPDTHMYGYWAVGKYEDDLYYLEVNEYAVRRLTDEAKSMMTIDL